MKKMFRLKRNSSSLQSSPLKKLFAGSKSKLSAREQGAWMKSIHGKVDLIPYESPKLHTALVSRNCRHVSMLPLHYYYYYYYILHHCERPVDYRSGETKQTEKLAIALRGQLVRTTCVPSDIVESARGEQREAQVPCRSFELSALPYYEYKYAVFSHEHDSNGR